MHRRCGELSFQGNKLTVWPCCPPFCSGWTLDPPAGDILLNAPTKKCKSPATHSGSHDIALECLRLSANRHFSPPFQHKLHIAASVPTPGLLFLLLRLRFLLRAAVFHHRLGCRQPRDRNAERRRAHVIHSDLMAELNAIQVASVFPADSHL